MKNLFYLTYLLALLPTHVSAHGFGERIDLPIPLNLYLVGAGAAIIVSFVLIGLIGKQAHHVDTYPRFNLLKISWIRALSKNTVLKSVIQIFFVLVLFLVVAAGLLGKQVSAFNIAPTVVWILFSVGITYVSAFIGNIWTAINPWKTIFTWLEEVSPGLSLEKEWPKVFGIWPAVILFIVYRWIENIYPNSAQPSTLSLLIVTYTLITFIGMIYFGRVNWLRFGDPFSVFFRFLSKFSITELRVVNGEKELNLRLPAVGLLEEEHIEVSHTVFVLFMLSSVAFDGVLATPIWQQMYLFLFNIGLPGLVVGTIGLLTLLSVFIGVYFIFSTFVRLCAKNTEPVYRVAYTFVFSLLPIAIAYEVAHFVSLLLIEGQRILYLISDPFGFGWNIFNTVSYKISFQVINLKTLWNWQVGLIIIGHIAAVYIAHMIALRFFQDRKSAIRSQYPMLLLMVFYTIFSLWIIAQPIVLSA